MVTASHTSQVSLPPTAAQFAKFVANTESGQIDVERLLMVVDCGRGVTPVTTAGQVEGGMAQALGFALSEEILYGKNGKPMDPTTRTITTFPRR